MKRNRLLTLLVLAVVSFFILPSWSGGYNGAEVASNPTGTGCSGNDCHGTASSTNALNIFMKDANGVLTNSYIPNETYTIEISFAKANTLSQARAGFQAIVTNALGTQIGTFQGTAMPTQVTNSTASLKSIMMSNTSLCGPISDLSGIVTWSFLWKAPLLGGGNGLINVIANDANGNGMPSGDNIFWANAPIIQGNPASVNDLGEDLQAIYPNPTSNLLNIKLSNSAESKVYVYSTAGQLLMNKAFSTDKLSLDVSHLSTGNYFISVEQNGKRAQRTIVKL